LLRSVAVITGHIATSRATPIVSSVPQLSSGLTWTLSTTSWSHACLPDALMAEFFILLITTQLPGWEMWQ